MKNVVFAMGAGLVALVSAAYLYATIDTEPRYQQVIARAEPENQQDERLGTQLADALLRQQQSSELRDRQAELGGKIEALEAKLRALEANDHAENDPNAEDDQPVPAKKTSEADLGHWMDESLRLGDWDQQGTLTAQAELEESLEQLPGVKLEEVDCGQRFCRATFQHDDGQPPELTSLFGTPPLTHQGFTVINDDGRVAVYFTRGGTDSLEELRIEAGQGDSPPPETATQ